MDTNINPGASEYVWISNSFEMTNFATTLRDIKKLTKKQYFKENIKRILNNANICYINQQTLRIKQ